LSDGSERAWIRVLVIVVSIVSFYFAVVSEVELVDLLLGAYGGVAQIFPLICFAFYWPRATRLGALTGLAAGIGANMVFLLAPELRPVPLHEGVYGLVANLVVFVVVSLLTRPEPIEKLQAYMGLPEPVGVKAEP
jgi:SSS family solute:Na+ symporter